NPTSGGQALVVGLRKLAGEPDNSRNISTGEHDVRSRRSQNPVGNARNSDSEQTGGAGQRSCTVFGCEFFWCMFIRDSRCQQLQPSIHNCSIGEILRSPSSVPTHPV